MFELLPRRMNVVRTVNPYSLFDLMDNFFNESNEVSNGIKTDVKESEKEYILEAELPGFKKEDITLETKNDILTIKARKEEKEEKKEKGYLRRERRYGSFERSFTLDGINENEIQAKYEDGILKVTLPKQEVKVEENKQIQIK